jgi:hypothetical protein
MIPKPAARRVFCCPAAGCRTLASNGTPDNGLELWFPLQPERHFDGELLFVQQNIVRPEKLGAIQNCKPQTAETALTFVVFANFPC